MLEIQEKLSEKMPILPVNRPFSLDFNRKQDRRCL